MRTEKALLELIKALGSYRAAAMLEQVFGTSVSEAVSEGISEAERATSYCQLILRRGFLSLELLQSICAHHPEQAMRALAVAHAAALPIEELLAEPETSRVLLARARARVLRTLPKILVGLQIQPCHLLTLAGMDTRYIRPGSALEQHIQVCGWLGENLPVTIQEILDLLNEAQGIAFSVELSDWAAKFCEDIDAIIRDPESVSKGVDVRMFVRDFARKQGERWRRIELQSGAGSPEPGLYTDAQRVASQNIPPRSSAQFDPPRARAHDQPATIAPRDHADMGRPRGRLFGDHMSRTSALDLLSVDEVADMLKTSRKAVYHRIARGQIPAVRLGRVVFVRRGDLAVEFRV